MSSNTSTSLAFILFIMCCLVDNDLAMKVWSCCKKDHEDGLTLQEEHISTGYVNFNYVCPFENMRDVVLMNHKAYWKHYNL